MAKLLGIYICIYLTAGWLGRMGRKRQPGHLLQPEEGDTAASGTCESDEGDLSSVASWHMDAG